MSSRDHLLTQDLESIQTSAAAGADAATEADGALDGLLREQAEALGITDANVMQLEQDLDSGAVIFQDVLGLTDAEMQAMAFRAEEYLRARNPQDALKIFFALCKLNSFEASYWRGSAMCFHHLKEYGFARGFYGMALATDADDRISEALRAECTLRLSGHVQAHEELTLLLSRSPSTDAKQQPSLERARLLRDKLSALPRAG